MLTAYYDIEAVTTWLVTTGDEIKSKADCILTAMTVF